MFALITHTQTTHQLINESTKEYDRHATYEAQKFLGAP